MKIAWLVVLVLILSLGGLIILAVSRSTSSSPSINSTPTTSPQVTPAPPQPDTTDLNLSIPSDIFISIYAKNLGSPRDLLWVEDHLLVSIPSKGQVVALMGSNSASVTQTVVASKLNRPHGLAYQDGRLYIAETDKVSVFAYDTSSRQASYLQKLIDLPNGGLHWTRSLLIHNNQLYISIGSSCNVCNESDLHRAAILASDLSGKGLHVFASGLRNSVFMTIDPKTNKIVATDNGRDNLGDNLPPDEINVIESGADYGWPYCYGQNIFDTSFDQAKYRSYLNQDPCERLNKTASFVDIPAHSAALGLNYFPDSWPAQYAGGLLVALHGSWNRSTPTGYKLILINHDLVGQQLDQQDFISGWLTSSGSITGRPVDVEFAPTNRLFISDDKSGNIYLVTPR